MKQYRVSSKILAAVLITLLLMTEVSANSSWRWISETRPYDVLPWVAVVTVCVETALIAWASKARPIRKIFAVVTAANMISFAASYVSCLFDMNYDFYNMLEHLPVYTVGIAYLFLTLLVEVPVVYYALRKNTGRSKQLLGGILGSNALTTVMVAIVERLLCRGKW